MTERKFTLKKRGKFITGNWDPTSGIGGIGFFANGVNTSYTYTLDEVKSKQSTFGGEIVEVVRKPGSMFSEEVPYNE